MKHLAALIALLPLLVPSPAQADPEIDQEDVLIVGVPLIPDELVDRLTQYQAIRRASLRDIDATGTKILVTTTFGETDQVHLVTQPGGARSQLTFRDERAYSPRFVPGSDRAFLFRSDIGGDEQHQIWRFEMDSGRATLLTKPGVRHNDPLWSPAGDRIVYASNERNGKDFDLWLADGASAEGARLLVEGSGYFDAHSWSLDGSLLVAHEYIAASDARLHIVDVEAGASTRIAGGGRKDTALYDQALFGRGNDELFVTSNRDGEFVQLYRATRKGWKWSWESLTADIDWDISSIAISDDRSQLAFLVNDQGYSTLYLLDTTTSERVRCSGLPSGMVYGLRFASEAPIVGFSLTGPDRTTDAWTWNHATGETVQWTFSEVGGLDPRRFVEPELITYESFDGQQIPAFYYRPQGAGPFPVLIEFHGGPEAQARPWFSAAKQFWVRELGIAMLVPNVRGSTGYGKTFETLDNGFLREDSVKDAGALLDWIATRPELDPDRVGVVGGSYGGYMVLATMMTYPDRIRAGMERVGISNFVTFPENTKEYRRDVRRSEYGDERDPAMRTFLEEISPANHADRITGALFVSQGANDPRVPASEGEQIVQAVQSAGGEVWWMLARNEGHGFRRQSNRDLWLQIATLFLEQHLLPAVVEDGEDDAAAPE
jgi:dipeptidyl aminopeptidase/acylaminoacyl peptidase